MTYSMLLEKIDAIKTEIDKHRPFPEQMQQQLKEYFRIGLTYTSNALEGNTLTETETKVLIEEGITIGGKSMRELLEVTGHSDAYTRMYELAHGESIGEKDILDFHRLFYVHIDPCHAGVYRDTSIYITGSQTVFPVPSKVPILMKDFIEYMQKMRVGEINTHEKIYHPVEYAALLHLRLVQIHPFVDGNGRTARLLMNVALLQTGYFIAIIPPILRHEYHVAIRACEQGDTAPFITFIARMVYESGKDYERMVKHLVAY